MDRATEQQLAKEIGAEIADSLQSEFESGELVVATVQDFDKRFYELLEANPKTPEQMFLYFKLDVRNITLACLQNMTESGN